MIPRYQRILFIVLLASSVVMAVLLVYLHQRNFSDVKNADDTPLETSLYSAADQVTLLLANDADGNIKPQTRLIALPLPPAVRARALLEHLLAEYALPDAAHKIGGGPAVDDVYLVPLPLGGPAAADASLVPTASSNSATSPAAATAKQDDADPLTHATGQLAIVNLRSAWVDAHPSGITTETLTIQSMVGTLHANLGEITAVRFLVDGKPRATLAGNVELDRTYDAADAAR